MTSTRTRSVALVLMLMIVAFFTACKEDKGTGPGGSASGISGTYVLQPVTKDSARIELFSSYSMYRFISQDETYPQSASIDSTGTWKQNGSTIEFLPHIRANATGIFQPPAFTGTIDGSTITLNGKQYTR